MGQLPPQRLQSGSPFRIVGVDYAGPITIKAGHTRRPVKLKSYICIFVCFAVKAVHIEAVSDLTTEAFLAALKRFVSRRGVPEEIHSDNGTNFQGASRELQDLYQLLSSDKT